MKWVGIVSEMGDMAGRWQVAKGQEVLWRLG